MEVKKYFNDVSANLREIKITDVFKLKPLIQNSLNLKAVQFYTQTLWLGFFSIGKVQRSLKRIVQNMMICFSSFCGHSFTL